MQSEVALVFPSLGPTSVFTSHLGEEGSLFSLLLQTVSHQPLHGLWTVAAHLTQVRRQVTPTHHEYNLTEQKNNIMYECVLKRTSVETSLMKGTST